jgi:hypothetical protein
MPPVRIISASRAAKGFQCSIREKTGTVFRAIETGDVGKRLQNASLLKALRIERNRPGRPQRES